MCCDLFGTFAFGKWLPQDGDSPCLQSDTSLETDGNVLIFRRSNAAHTASLIMGNPSLAYEEYLYDFTPQRQHQRTGMADVDLVMLIHSVF